MRVSNGITLVVIVSAIAIFYSELSSNFEVDTVQVSDGSDSYAARATDNGWPNIDESQANIASDLSTKNYYLVFDGSGSMEESGCSNRRNKINVAKESVTKTYIAW